MLRDFFLGFIKVHILHHAAEGEVYGLALIDELRHHGYDVSAGTLYPVLHQLETDGYLARTDRVVNGKVRKYYVATPRGSAMLKSARKQIRELVDEVVAPHAEPRRARTAPQRAARRSNGRPRARS